MARFTDKQLDEANDTYMARIDGPNGSAFARAVGAEQDKQIADGLELDDAFAAAVQHVTASEQALH